MSKYYVVDPGIEEQDFIHDSLFADTDEQAIDEFLKRFSDPRGYELLKVEKINVQDRLRDRAQNN